MTVGYGSSASLTLQRSAPQARHLSRGPGLINEDQPARVQVRLRLEPGLTSGADIGSFLLGGMSGLFLYVQPRR